MYMDEQDTRHPREGVDGELLRRLLGEEHALACPMGGRGRTPCARGDGGNAADGGDRRPCPKNGLVDYALAMVYAPIADFRALYDPQTALSRGTLFRELDLPFRGDGKYAGGGNCRGY